MRAQYILGIDIETGGPVIGVHPLLAIGFCIYRWNGNINSEPVLEDTIEVHMEADEKSYEPDTLEWWKKQKTWEYIKSDCIMPEEAAKKLITFLRKWQKHAIDCGLPLKTVTDNCWFDDTWISWFLCIHGQGQGKPLRHNYYKGYTKIDDMIDINQRTTAARELGRSIGCYVPTVPHDHTPVSDARGIVEKYVNYMKVTAQYRRYKN